MEQGNPSGSSRPRIPGPAGVVQAALRARRSTTDAPLIPTQEYVRQVLEDGSTGPDPDFNSTAWLSALQLGGSATPLGAIKTRFNSERVETVVAVITSCTPTNFGGANVALKDPTGTIGGTIHHKVFTDSDFANDITVGAALLLQKVVVFAPRNSAYLNITLPNIVKDCGPQDFVDITEN